jgi:cyanophycin synthetase
MRDRTPGDLVLFSTKGENESKEMKRHLARNGIGACIENDTFVIRRGRLRIPIAPVREVPLMLGGAAKFQRENVLAAIATAYVQGIRYDDIRAGLLSFFPSPSLTPGRLNIIPIAHGRVIVDYAHNPAAIAGIVEFALSLEAGKRIGVVTAPGDRRDDDLRTVGRLSAPLDHVIIKEDAYRRGREPGAISALIAEGLEAGGMSRDRYEIIYDENDAIRRAIEMMYENDVALVLADNVNASLSTIRSYSPESAR